MRPIIRFNYLYRDAGNYKAWGEIYFSNPDKLELKSIDKQLKRAFDQEVLFIAHQIGVPEVFLYKEGGLNTNDHCFHEYDCVELVENVDFSLDSRSVKQFIQVVEKAAASGWNAFNPLDELASIQERLSL